VKVEQCTPDQPVADIGGVRQALDQSEEIARRVPGARLAIFEQSGHSPQIEERAAFTTRLAAFLGS
jgi:pimeloyl-ACP methyl ester carboxylesterase